VAWLFAQVWVLCLLSFLLGALATWLAVGRAQHRAPTSGGGAGWVPPAFWSATGRSTAGRSGPDARTAAVEPRAEPPGPPVEPALAALDAHGPDGRRPRPGLGAAATGALDLLGVPEPGPAAGGPAADASGPRARPAPDPRSDETDEGPAGGYQRGSPESMR
jgi:hypothetical protein